MVGGIGDKVKGFGVYDGNKLKVHSFNVDYI